MSMQTQTSVLVVGAGPVGLTLAMDLARRGVAVLVVEIRHVGEAPNVKCNHVSARSMEIFRRLGVARALRNTGLPPDYPNDVAYRTTVTGPELSRIPIPARRDRYTARGGPDTDWPTAEPPHRINQIFLEPVLFAHAQTMPGLRILNRTRIDDVAQDDAGVTATGVNLDTGRALYDLNVNQYCCGGLNFGYFYDQSPLIRYDGEAAPAYTMAGFTPSTVPGCRTPHFCLPDGRSLYDALGDDFTLLRTDRAVDTHALEHAARLRGVPLQVLDIDVLLAPPVYGHKLVLSRPDQHVAWRGDLLPHDALALVDQVRGAGPHPHPH